MFNTFVQGLLGKSSVLGFNTIAAEKRRTRSNCRRHRSSRAPTGAGAHTGLCLLLTPVCICVFGTAGLFGVEIFFLIRKVYDHGQWTGERANGLFVCYIYACNIQASTISPTFGCRCFFVFFLIERTGYRNRNNTCIRTVILGPKQWTMLCNKDELWFFFPNKIRWKKHSYRTRFRRPPEPHKLLSPFF